MTLQFQGMVEKLNDLTKVIADFVEMAKKIKQKARDQEKA